MSMKTKIAALIAKAKSSTHPEEQETFLAKARELMEKHQIDSIELETGSEVDPIGTLKTTSFAIGTPAAVKYELGGWVAEYFGCTIILVKMGQRGWLDIHGSESSRTTYEAMFPYVWSQVLDLARANGPTAKERRKLQRDISQALGIRLRRLKAEAKAARQVESSSGSKNALVLVDVESRVDDYVAAQYDSLGEGKSPKRKGPGSLGRTLAEQVSLANQVNGSGSRTLLL